MISKSTFYQILFILTCFHCSWSQTLFQENMGSPTSTTNITSNVFENTTSLSYSNGEQSNSADVRITNASTGYSGASSGGNIFFSSTAGAYGFSIEGINASSYTSLSLQFGYRKESSTSHALFSVDYWNGSAWVVLANSETDLFNESTSASAKWYLSKVLTLPLEARINGLKIRFVKTGNKAIRIDDVLLTANGTPIDTPSSSSDIVFNPSSSTSSNTNINYLNYQADVITSTTNSVGVMGFYLRDGGVSLNDNDSLATELTEITFNVTNSTNIRSARLFVGNSPRGVTVPVNGASTITFTGLTNIIAADNDQLAINLRVTFNEVVTDNEQVQFTVSSATASSTGSKFSIANAGGASSSISGDINRIEVTASKLEFSQQPPSSSYVGTVMPLNPTIVAKDGLENIDLDYNGIVTLTLSGNLNIPLTTTAIDGIAIFIYYLYDFLPVGTGYVLTANSNNLNHTTSNPFEILASPTMNLSNIPIPNCVNTCNLIPNGGFEEYTQLPGNDNPIDYACGWYTARFHAKYFNSNPSTNPNYSIPCNFYGSQICNENQGNGYGGIFYFSSGNQNNIVSSMMVSRLSSPLVAGQSYQLSFDVSLAEGLSYNSKTIQAYLSPNIIPIPTNSNQVVINNPQMLFSNSTTSTISDGWQTITFTFTSTEGGEEYIYLGAFQNVISQPNTLATDTSCNYITQPISMVNASFYYIDNVRLIPIANLNLPDTICNTANLSNLASFLSNAPTNGIFTGIGVVENSGIYSLDATIAGVGTHTISYVYTNAMGCPITITDEITVVTDGIIAEFDFLNNLVLCENSTPPVLPTTSDNGITGTWSPSTISTASSVTYTFTPNTGQCGIDTIKSIVINENVTPIFTPVYGCNGVPLNSLPTVSTNGITGTWSPAISNQPNTIYTFTPTSGLCANTTTDLTIITASIEAVNDDFSATPINTLTGGTTPSVFANDTLNGVLVTSGVVARSITDVTPTINPWPYINSNGEIVIPAGTTIGTYSITYNIADISCRSNISTATVNIIVAEFEIPTPQITSGTRANNIVSLVDTQSDGKIIIAGHFTAYNNIPCNKIARLKTDLTYDSSFSVSGPYPIDDTPLDMKVIKNVGSPHYNKIIIVGSFSSFNGTPTSYGIARLNSDGTVDQTFNSGTMAPGVVRGFDGNNKQARTIYIYPNGTPNAGKILVGGMFSTYNGVAREKMVRLNENGTLDTSFNPNITDVLRPDLGNIAGFDSTPSSFLTVPNGVLDDKIIVGGYFQAVSGYITKCIARLNDDGSLDMSFNNLTSINDYNQPIGFWKSQSDQHNQLNVEKMVLQPDGKIIVAGIFRRYNGNNCNNIVRLFGGNGSNAGTVDTSFAVGSGFDNDIPNPITGRYGLVRDLILDDVNGELKLYVCGDFTKYKGVAVDEMIRLNCLINAGNIDNSFTLNGSGPNGTNNGPIWCLKKQGDGKIIIGGQFSNYAGLSALNVTRIFPAAPSFEARMASEFYESEPEIDLFADTEIVLYPNPTKDKINFMNNNVFENNFTIAIYNSIGQKVQENNFVLTDTQINVSSLSNGTYFIRFTDGLKTVTKAVIIKQ